MADKKTEPDTEAPKKKGKGKLILILVAVLVAGGGGAGGWMYFGRASAAETAEAGPRLVPKSEQKRPVGEGGEGHGDTEGAEATGGAPTPHGAGGDRYASNYFALDKDFTSNLRESVHFVQVGVAVSTPYDETVIEHLKTHEIAVRSAILMTLGDTSEEQVFTSDGKKQLQARLVQAINATLKEKEGFGGISNVYFTNFVVQ